jgi:hypothetical protein
MNIQDLDLLRRYKVQNPRKYALKFGDKLPEEVVLKPANPFNTGSVKVEVGQAKAVEMELKEPAPEPVFAPPVVAPTLQEEPKAPKKVRKPVKNVPA